MTDVEAALTLLAISRDNSHRFSAAEQEAADALLSLNGYNDSSHANMLTQMLDSCTLNGSPSNRDAAAAAQDCTVQPAGPASPTSKNNLVSNADTSQDGSPTQTQPSTSEPLSLPISTHYQNCSDVPESLGRFVYLCARFGCSLKTIQDILRVDNFIVPAEYICQRLGAVGQDINLQGRVDQEWSFQNSNMTTYSDAHGEDAQMDESDDEDQDSTQSWQDQLEQWFEWR